MTAGGETGGVGPAPGWYPVDGGAQRYWDGSAWTEHIAPGSLQGAVSRPPGDVTSDDKTMALLIHLLTLVSGFLGPLIIWLVKRDDSAFVDHHGKEALNFQLTMLLAWFGAFLASLILIGLLAIPVLLVAQVLFPILAAVAANRGELYRYPMTIRFIS